MRETKRGERLTVWQPPSNSFHSRFYSRFAPGFAPDPGSNAIALHRTRGGRTPHVLNEIITLRRTQSHLITIGVNRPLKARALVSGDRRCATTLLPEQPNTAQPIMTMISPIPQFFLRIARPGPTRPTPSSRASEALDDLLQIWNRIEDRVTRGKSRHCWRC